MADGGDDDGRGDDGWSDRDEEPEQAPRPEGGRMIGEDGPGGRAAFDPTPYMRQLRGRGGAQDYLDVKWRLLWLRREHPDAQIVTEHVRIEETSAIFKATVSLPSGGMATGYGSETAGDFGDFIEKAETKAIGRALNALGYGAQFAEGDEDAAAPSPAPVPATRPAARPSARPAARATPAAPDPAPSPPAAAPQSTPPATATRPPARPPATSPAAPARPEATRPPADAGQSSVASPSSGPGPRPVDAAAAPPIDLAERRPPPRPTQIPPPRPDPAATPTDEPDLADYSYTAFWSWARGLGYHSKGAIEDLVGRPITGLPPAEVRDLVRAARGET